MIVNLIALALLLLILLFSLGNYFSVKLALLKIESLELRLEKRLQQSHAMQYNMMHKQGWTHEELSEAFPVIETPNT